MRNVTFVLVVLLGFSCDNEKNLEDYYREHEQEIKTMRSLSKEVYTLMGVRTFMIRKSGVGIEVHPLIEESNYGYFQYDENTNELVNWDRFEEDSMLAASARLIAPVMTSPKVMELVRLMNKSQVRIAVCDSNAFFLSLGDAPIRARNLSGDLKSGILINEDETLSGSDGIVRRIDKGIFIHDALPR